MPQVQSMPSNILLCGLECSLKAELTEALREFTSLLHQSVAGVIFCRPDAGLVRGLRLQFAAAPIIVVSRVAEVRRWLDALEAGASDYCAAPFESHQIRWILDSSLRYN